MLPAARSAAIRPCAPVGGAAATVVTVSAAAAEVLPMLSRAKSA